MQWRDQSSCDLEPFSILKINQGTIKGFFEALNGGAKGEG
jgi:hypothetical protein